jgi:ABC-type uncharacterized transport system involved in gliding motility auxiliary subunit
MKTKSLNSAVGILALLGIVIFGNVILTRMSLRLDVTEEKLYTLSEGTLNILEGLKAPLNIKLFFSQKLEGVPPILKTYHQRVRAMLEEFQRKNANINLEFIDPEPDSDEELLAQRYNVAGQPLSSDGNFYFGLVFSNFAGEESIPYLDFNKEDTLEYDLVRRIYLLSLSNKPKIGVLSSFEVLGQEAPPQQFGMPQQPPQGAPAWLFTQELNQSYDMVSVDPSSGSLDNDLDLLLVIHAKALDEKMQYAIDQFVMKGKRAIFFVDPFVLREEQNQQNRMRPPTPDNSFDKLFKKWGVDYNNGKVVLDPLYAYIQRGMGSSTKMPTVIDLKSESMSDDVSTNKLNNMRLLFTGQVGKIQDVEGVEFKALLSTSKEAQLEDKFKLMYSRPEQLLADLKGKGSVIPLAGLFSGKFRSAFDKAPEGVNGEHLVESKTSNHIIVVADVDMLEDQYWAQTMNFMGQTIIQPSNQNTVFLNNIVEKLSGSNDLISLRSRSRSMRPFEKVLEIEEQARRSYQAREKELQEQLQNVEAEITKLMQKADPGQRVIVSAEVQAEIKSFQEKKAVVAKELRGVRKDLRSSIVELGTTLQAINILLIPLLLALFGSISLYTKSRRISA